MKMNTVFSVHFTKVTIGFYVGFTTFPNLRKFVVSNWGTQRLCLVVEHCCQVVKCRYIVCAIIVHFKERDVSSN